MGRAFVIEVPASGVGVDPVPISVSGTTYFASQQSIQVAYDPADFASDQYVELSLGTVSIPSFNFAPNTILWLRQDPGTPGLPAFDLSVWTQIGQVNY